MTEAEKLKVQIEAMEAVVQIVRDGRSVTEYSDDLARYVERRTDYQVALLRFTLKQLNRQPQTAA